MEREYFVNHDKKHCEMQGILWRMKNEIMQRIPNKNSVGISVD
jgi:hypothetical protein